MAAVDSRTRGGAVELQAEAGMKLLLATQATGAEYDSAGAEAYRKEVETKIAKLEMEATQLTGKDNKKERSAKGKEVADLKNEHKYVDACKVVKGLEPKFGHFITKAAVLPEIEKTETVQEAAPEQKAKKESKKEKKPESAGLSPDELKELEDLKQKIIEEKAILKEQGMSGGQINKNEKIVTMVTRLNELKEKQDPGSSKKDKDKTDAKKKTPLSAEEQREYTKLVGDIGEYKLKLKNEFGYSNKEIKADPDLKEMEARLAALEKRGASA